MLVVDAGRVVMDSSPASIDREQLARVLGVPEV